MTPDHSIRNISFIDDTAHFQIEGFDAAVDRSDLDLVLSRRWCVMRSKGDRPSYIRAVGRAAGEKVLFLHHLLLPTPPGFMPDHIDRNGLNNRRSNLRLATHSQNCCNRTNSKNTTGFRGVHIHRTKTRNVQWIARIRLHQRTHYLGLFPTPEAAARAYDAAARVMHGEFASLNFPDSEAA